MSSGAQILLTGVTGFVGKVVLETLLRRQHELGVGTVYVLIRAKGAKTSIQERFLREVAASPCFGALPAGWEQSVKVLAGDLTQPALGLDAAVQAPLHNTLTHVINCAASVEFDLPLADAAAANITSALNVLEMARQCSQLVSFVNVSTAYVSPHPGEGVPIPESLVSLPFDPEVVYQQILDGSADQVALMAQTGHPNTYTFTKCLSEHLLSRRRGAVPLAIVRPSIISASWQYPYRGWIDSYAAFAGFVSLIGAGLLKCVAALENAVLDVVPCDEVAHRVVQTAFWPRAKVGPPPLIQHITSGLHQGCRIESSIAGIESYFQRHPLNRWAQVHRISNGKPLHFEHWRHHVLPTQVASLWFSLSGQSKQKRQAQKLLQRMGYLNTAFPYFTHHSFAFQASTPLTIPEFEPKQYIEIICRGVSEFLMRRKPEEMSFAGSRHRHPHRDLRWVRRQPEGNWAIRAAAYVVRKGLRRCTDVVTFDRSSFESALAQADPHSLRVVVPNHRSYMDFLLCSYLFFAHPELRVAIPQIAAANDFARLPFLGWFFRQTYAFYIPRGQGKADPALTAQIQQLVADNQTLEFFIEGTRSRSRQFLPPRRGILRALQSTGVKFTLLPIAFSYDLIPEEKVFLAELGAGPKLPMQIGGLFRWAGRLIRGEVCLGRVHIVCGEPVILQPESDVHAVSQAVMRELQDKTAVSSFHLAAFLQHHPLPGVDLEWLQQALKVRGARVLESPLEDVSGVTALNERTLRYQWMHHFYADLLAFKPGHPALLHHVSSNAYVPVLPAVLADIQQDRPLQALLTALFQPIAADYRRLLDLALQHGGHLDQAHVNGLVTASPASFLPVLEDGLKMLVENELLQTRSEGGWQPGPRWQELSQQYTACTWAEDPSREVWRVG